MADAFAREEFPDRQDDDLEVQPQRAVIDVPHVQREFLLPGERVAPVDLRPTGDPGPHLVTAGLLRRVAGQVLHQQRARADQAHVTFEHVEKLRQLIEAKTAQKAPESCKPLRVREQGALRVAGVGHGAEFVEGEGLAVQSGALLAKEHGRAEFEAHQEGDHQ